MKSNKTLQIKCNKKITIMINVIISFPSYKNHKLTLLAPNSVTMTAINTSTLTKLNDT